MLNHIWQVFQEEGAGGLGKITPDASQDWFYLALLAYGAGDISAATRFVSEAANRDSWNRLYSRAQNHLRSLPNGGKKKVYATGEGFAVFSGYGGNIPLYEKTSALLSSIYKERTSFHLLDIGVGEGRALLPALTDNVSQLDLLEPSAPMLEKCRAFLNKKKIPYNSDNTTIQQFIKEDTRNRDLIQSTFCLQSIAPDEKPAVLKWIRRHCHRFLMVEFDVPDFAEMFEPRRVVYYIETYEAGLAEYLDNNSVPADVAEKAVMGFDAVAFRTNYEQSIKKWCDELKIAGFTSVTTRKIYDYWWAPAYLLDAC